MQEVKNNRKSLIFRPKKSRSRSLTGGGRLVETLAGKFRCFGLVVVYKRWSLTRGGRTWKFDCSAIHYWGTVNSLATVLVRLNGRFDKPRVPEIGILL